MSIFNKNFIQKHGFHVIEFKELNEEKISKTISLLRSIKQAEISFLVMYFDKTIKPIKRNTVKDRLEWSKLGQLLTNLISNLTIPVIGIVNKEIYNEFSEIVLSCHYVWSKNNNLIKFKYDFKREFFCFGTLKRIQSDTDYDIVKILEINFKANDIVIPLLKKKDKFVFSNNLNLESKIKQFSKHLDKNSIFDRLLARTNQSKSPLENNSIDFLEATIYSNKMYDLHHNKILKTNLSNMNFSSNNLTIADGIDDIGNDYMNLKNYPDDEIRVLNRKRRIEEVNILLEQKIAPIRGKCIELGSGYGYFSSLASKKNTVTKIIASDISMAEICLLGPYMWEYLKPDWKKLFFRIEDMNNISSEYKTFDTVIFCASLHHSSDIKKSLEVAYNLLKKGGSLILHGEHYHPEYFKQKKNLRKNTPHTIKEFKKLLKQTGFEPKVFRYMLSSRRYTFLKKLLFVTKPFSFLNGLIFFHNFMMLGVKK